MRYAIFATALGVPEPLRGWAIPCATNIAFSYLVARFVIPPGDLLQQAKLGALFSLSAAALASVAARMLRRGRFAGATMSASLSSGR
jgi:hypothetical protein